MGKLIKGGVFGGIILFVWAAISWTLLNWHITTFEPFPNENTASEFIQSLPTSGMYMLPMSFKLPNSASQVDKDAAMEENNQRKTKGPIVFAAVSKQGTNPNMFKEMGISLVSQIIAALLVTGLVLIKPHTQYSHRLFQVILFALAAGIVTHIPYMNWFVFSPYYTLISMLDLLIGWFFAGLVISYFTRPRYPSFY